MHGRAYYGNEYPDQNVQEDTQDGAKAGYPEEHHGIAVGAEEPYEDEGAHARVTIESEDSEEEEKSAEETQPQWMPDKPRILSDEAVRARMHEAEVQADLAKEMSRISDGRHRPETTLPRHGCTGRYKGFGERVICSGIPSFHDRSRVFQFRSGPGH